MSLLKVTFILCAVLCPSLGKIVETRKLQSILLVRYFDSSKTTDNQQAKMFDELRRSLKTYLKLSFKEIDCARSVNAECKMLNNNKTNSSYFLFDDQAALLNIYYGPQEFEYLRRYCLAQLGVKVPRSLPIPAALPGIGYTAKRLTAFTFDNAISTNFSFVIFYASWCPHCIKFTKIWNSLDEKFKDNTEINIFRVDCMEQQENDLCLQQKVFGFPTINLYKNGVWMKEYEGRRRLNEVLDFLLSHRTEKGIKKWELRQQQREIDERKRQQEKAAKRALQRNAETVTTD